MHVKKLPHVVASEHMPAVALTDTNNMFGALEFSEVASLEGVQPIVGCQMNLAYMTADNPRDRNPLPLPIVLLVQSEIGYLNLMKLSSCLFLESGDEPAHITTTQLQKYNDGLICLTGGALGPVGQLLQDGHIDKAKILLKHLSEIFLNRTYVEIQRHGSDGEKYTLEEQKTEKYFLEMAYSMELPLVATNDVYFPNREMYAAHDALLCISEGSYVDQQDGRRRLTPEHYFKSSGEMIELFKDLPEAIDNTIEIAKKMCF